MIIKRNVKKASLITGAFLAGAVAGFASTSNSNVNELLDFDALGSGNEIRVEIADMNTNHAVRTLELKFGDLKASESKCGEGKCGEGKCGGSEKESEKESVKEKSKAKSSKAKSKESRAKAKSKKKKGNKVG